ncbi:MAG: FAD-dependent monooxygenase [Actinomycetota bacterium]|nr:FAD-dependent monooxygenase [Actinomycetota bacterium]
MRPKRILILGGGPGGLYSGLLLKKSDPAREVTVLERNPKGATYGFGIVFSDATLRELQDADPETHAAITRNFAKWDAIDVRWKDEVIRTHGHAFAGLSRMVMLEILQNRCAEVGVDVAFNHDRTDFSDFSDYDLVIAADGSNSLVRRQYEGVFQPSYDVTARRYVWLGTSFRPDAIFFVFRQTEFGLFLGTIYPFTGDLSTLVVECDPSDWRRAGLDEASETETAAFAEKIFAEDLSGGNVVANKSTWLNFVTIKNRTWHRDNMVLVGDSAHTAHYSVGSGTRMAMEDAIALSQALDEHDELEEALVYYERGREPITEAIQEAAKQSYAWFTNLSRYEALEPIQLAFNLVTRSGRIGYDNLRIRDAVFVDRVDRWFSMRARRVSKEPIIVPPPMFTPQKLREMGLSNMIVLSPVGLFSASDGMPTDAHLDRLLARAEGGAGLVMSELTAIAPGGRITPGDTGMYSEDHVREWKRVVDAIHERSFSKAGICLNHAGRRGSARPREEGLDRPLKVGAWPLMSASAIAYSAEAQVPKEMDRDDMLQVRSDFVRAAAMSNEAGFDILNLFFAHGYLVASFISPLTNRRKDEYGGSLNARMKFPLELFDAVRTEWPSHKPLAVSISASDLTRTGLQPEDGMVVARMFKEHGCDVIEVLAGQTIIHDTPSYGRYFLTDLSDLIRNLAGIKTMTRGRITKPDEANTILAGGRADLAVMDPPGLL